MLIELRIQNYAIIDRLALELGPGLNVLSGETGAGKSIIVGALSLLLGERASADLIGAGGDRALVEGVFDISGHPEIPELLDEYGVEQEEGLLILRREVARAGRNRAWVNGSPATATLVGELGQRLVDMHGQHEHQTLLRQEEQRKILDEYAATTPLVREVEDAYRRMREIEAELVELERRRREAEERAGFLRDQLREIEKVGPRPGEEEELEEEAHRLEHAEDLAILSRKLHQSLYATEDSVIARLAELRKDLDELIRIDPSQADTLELFEPAYINLEELGRRMGDYTALIEYDPARLEEIRRRQDLIFRLKTRYGPEIEDVIERGRQVKAELDLIDTADFERRALERKRGEAGAKLIQLADQLSKARRQAAETLEDEVAKILPELGLAGGRFQIAFHERSEIGPDGAEEIEFQIALNVGFEPRPLARVASGGELSRVMLALKTVLARQDRIPSLVFDEIDTGIGGQIGHRLGDKLRQVADHHQVFVITHLAQVAARADQHFRVEKGIDDEVAKTYVVALDEEERLRELTRMLGGDPSSEASLEYAREMLQIAGNGNG